MPEDILFPELTDVNDGDPNYWKSIIQTNLEDYIRDENRNKAVMDPDEIMSTYKIDLP
jgi:hypothetical protein